MGIKTIKCICLLIIFLLTGHLHAGAQNNPYKIDDALYTIYQRATKNRINPKGLLIADTLYNEAIKKRDKKAQCLALTIPVVYYFYSDQPDKLEQAIAKTKRVSRENGYLQYYYFAGIHKVNYLINNNNSLRALEEVEMLKEQAFKDKHDYGITTCMRIMGNIYLNRSNWKEAMKHYKEALEYTQRNMPNQDLAMQYWNIANCYKELKQYKEAYDYAKKGIQVAKTNINKLSCLILQTNLLYHMGRYDEFEKSYQETMKFLKEYGGVKVQSTQEMNLYRHLINNEYKEAHAVADSMSLPIDRAVFNSMIFSKEGNSKEAYDMLNLMISLKDSINQQIQSADLAELNVRIGNERLKHEAHALQLDNTRLNLRNATLKLDQAKAQIDIEKMHAYNNKLQLNNRNLELAQLKTKAERQQHLLKEQQLRARNRQSQLILGLVSLILLVIGLVVYLYIRHQTISALHRKNKELIAARERAEQADRMKTLFIQNMSHEIRTPLNAVVGFSQILADSTLRISDEEKDDFSARIQQNSDLLTTLINDILDLSSLESGKYVLDMQSWSCNELCRISLDTVEHRKSLGVKIYFTTEVADDFKINTDGKRLQQVLINFLTNAEKNTVKGEIRLHCSLSEYPNKVTFSVTDTGPGIPPDKADTIFERFKKLDAFKQGTGLGLNICRIIAERLHGEVLLDKSYTSGARFLFILPIEEA